MLDFSFHEKGALPEDLWGKTSAFRAQPPGIPPAVLSGGAACVFPERFCLSYFFRVTPNLLRQAASTRSILTIERREISTRCCAKFRQDLTILSRRNTTT